MLARCIYEPRSRRRHDLERFLMEVDGLFSSFIFGGQVWVKQVSKGWIDGALVVLCEIPECHSLAPRWDGHDTRRRRLEVERLCARKPTVDIISTSPRSRVDRAWKRTRSLVLYGPWFDWRSPVLRGTDSLPIPSYRFGLPDETRTRLMDWLIDYQSAFGIFHSHAHAPLETAAYKQIASPDSPLMKVARGLSEEIESCTGRPTYTYLHRFFGRDEERERSRTCPLCSGDWHVHSQALFTYRGLDSYNFKCVRCRLISIMGTETSLRLAHIGE